MIVGANVNPPLQLIFNDEIIERVFVYKLLEVLIDTTLRWDNHIDSICFKASSRLHFLTQLKRNGATVKDVVHFYETLIRSVLEYACPAWHSSLTVEQCFRIESIQKRSFKLIYGSTSHYENLCHNYLHVSYPTVENFYVNVFIIPLRTVKAA